MEGRLSRFIIYLYIYTELSCAVVSFDTGSNGSRIPIGVLQDLPSLCPYNRYCQSPLLTENSDTDFTPCCQKCSCDKDCHEIGNCCPDNPSASEGKVKYPCVNLANVSSHSFSSIDNGLWYHVIDDCKDIFNELAHPHCYQPTELQDLVVVSDPDSGRVYKNSHCAICNDVENYVSWMLQLSGCPDIYLSSFKTIEERDKHLFEKRKECHIYSVPPNSTTGELSRCFPDSEVLNRCNITGHWVYYDISIEEACLSASENHNAIFVQKNIMQRDQMYANVYCYLCNTPRNTKRNDECKRTDYNEEYKSGVSVRFSALIDIRTKEKSVHDSPCKQIEIWDPFSKLCRTLACPVGTIPEDGSCRSILSQSVGYSILINFEITFDNHNMNVTSKELLIPLERSMFPMFGSGCGKGFTGLLGASNFSTLILELNVYPTETCPTETILSNAQKLGTKGEIRLKYKFKGQGFQFQLRLVFGTFTSGFNVLAFEFYTDIRTIRRIDSTILHYCPSIKLARQEVYSLGLSGLDMNRKESYLENDENTDIQSVCVDMYFQTRSVFSGTVSRLQHDKINNWFLFQSLAILIYKKFQETLQHIDS